MKLLYRTTRDFLVATAVILLITGIGLYLYLQKEVNDEMNEQLAFQAELISKQLETGQSLAYPFAQVTPTNLPATPEPVYGDTLIYDVVQKKKEEYHYFNEVRNIKGQHYQIRVMTSHIGWDKYYQTIFFTLLTAIFLLAASGVVITYFSNKKLWKPFFQNLQSMRNYSISDPQHLQLYDSPIAEFSELRKTLKDLTERSHREYMALREFTENASHEIQTPLSIIQSKLDRLSQLEITEEMARYIVQAKSGADRLSKMNKNLLLLAKLDNNAFEDRQKVPLQELLQHQLDIMADLYTAREITVTTHIQTAEVIAAPYLCEIMLSNLAFNALRYTSQGGKVSIELSAQQLTMANQAPPLDFDPELLFDRFKKSSKNSQSTGLGLAIVKQICEQNGWQISYAYVAGMHTFTIIFQ